MKIENIKIIDILQDGRGVARTDSKTAFIEGAIFGEVLDCEIIQEKNNFFEAKKIKTIEQSPYYKQPPCPYFYECGGCSIMNLEYQTQLELKKNSIKNSIKKTCKIDLENLEIIPSKEFRYRNKIRLQVDGHGKLAYNKKNSNDLVKVDDCLIARKIISDNFIKIGQITEDICKRYPNSLKEISIRTNNIDILINISMKNSKAEIINYIEDNYKNSEFLIKVVGKSERIISKRDYLDYKVLDKDIRISSNDFYQVNDYQIENLYKQAKEFLGQNKRLLDLYCGSATSSIAINGDNIVGVDINKHAIEDANKNAERNNLKNYKFLAKDSKYITDKFIKKEKIDAIIVDPPRAGLDKDVVKHISNVGIKEVVYISCNPQTLARDISRFINNGFTLKKIKACDMFPQSMHVETIALIQKM